jgi:hypothetical protein
MAKKTNKRRNDETGLVQTSVWLKESDIQALREIGKRPDIDREWSWLARKAMQEFIKRDRERVKQAAFDADLDKPVERKAKKS